MVIVFDVNHHFLGQIVQVETAAPKKSLPLLLEATLPIVANPPCQRRIVRTFLLGNNHSLILYGIRFRMERRRLKTQLTSSLQRSPGESLRVKTDDLSEDVTFYALFMMGAPFMIYSTRLSQSYFGGILETPFRINVSVLIVLGILTFSAMKLVHALNLRRRLRLAHDSEKYIS